MISLRRLVGDDADVLRETKFQLLLLANVAPLGTALLSPVMDSLIGPFGTSAANVGLLISVFTAPGIVVIPIAGALADRYGRKPVLVVALTLFGLAGSAIAFTTDFRVALALRFLQGIAFGGLNPILITTIGDLYTGSKDATAQGLRFTTSGVVQTVFPLVAGVLVTVAWQYPFLLYAVSLPAAVVVFFRFEEPPAADASPAWDGGTSTTYGRALYSLATRRRVFAMILARSLGAVIWLGFLTFNSIIVVRLIGGSPWEAGLLVAVGSIAYAVAATQAGRVTSRASNDLSPLFWANGCLTVGFLVVVFAPSVAVATVGITVAGAGLGITLSLYRSIINGLAPASLRAGLVSIAEAGGRGAATLSPIVMGAIVALTTPLVGFGSAVQMAGVTVAILGGVGSILCLLVVKVSTPASADGGEVSGD